MAPLLDEFPSEVIHDILVFALDTSPHTFRSLAITNKCLSEAARVVQGRRKTLRIDKTGFLSQAVLDNLSCYENVHHLTVESTTNNDLPYYQPQNFVKLVAKIKALKTLTWNVGPISNRVLMALREHHPNCKLRIFKWWRIEPELDRLHKSELALAWFENLTHLRFTPFIGISGPQLGVDNAWMTFRELVGKSQSLKLASFICPSQARDIALAPWIWTIVMDPGLTKADYPESDIGSERVKPKHLKSITIDCPYFEISSSTLDEIDNFADLAKLEYLKLSRGDVQVDYLKAAATRLPNVKHVSMNFQVVQEETILKAAKEYLLECSPLHSLSLWGWTAVLKLEEIVARHGQSLRSLQLHEKEDTKRRDLVLSQSDIEFLKESCPHLTELTLDSADHGLGSDSGNIDIFRSLGDGKLKLQKVQVYLHSAGVVKMLEEPMETDSGHLGEVDSGNDDSDSNRAESDRFDPETAELSSLERRKSQITPKIESYAISSWKKLFGSRSTGDRHLVLKVGDWESRQSIVVPNLNPRVLCEVSPHERDDLAGGCIAKTKYRTVYSRDED